MNWKLKKLFVDDLEQKCCTVQQMVAAKRNELGLMFRMLRKRGGFTLRDVDTGTGVPFASLSKMEAGQRATGPGHAAKICNFLNLQGDEREKFITLASETLTRRGAGQASSECPAFLSQLFGEYVRLSLGLHLRMLDTFGVIGHKGPFENSDCSKLYYACERGARPAPLRPALLQEISRNKDLHVLLVVFLRKHRQALVQCNLQIFDGKCTERKTSRPSLSRRVRAGLEVAYGAGDNSAKGPLR